MHYSEWPRKTTLSGRIVYDRPLHVFSWQDARRILCSALPFNTAVAKTPSEENWYQLQRLYHFLFASGFWNPEWTYEYRDTPRPEWYKIARSTLNTITSLLGVGAVESYVGNMASDALADFILGHEIIITGNSALNIWLAQHSLYGGTNGI